MPSGGDGPAVTGAAVPRQRAGGYPGQNTWHGAPPMDRWVPRRFYCTRCLHCKEWVKLQTEFLLLQESGSTAEQNDFSSPELFLLHIPDEAASTAQQNDHHIHGDGGVLTLMQDGLGISADLIPTAVVTTAERSDFCDRTADFSCVTSS